MDGRGKLRAGLYERVSELKSGPEARSVAEQNEANSQSCDRNGWTITARYTDPGISASRYATKERDEWPKLRADVAAGLLDVVVLWEPSRGDRKLDTGAGFLDDCRENNVLIYITSHDRAYDMRRARDRSNLAEDLVDAEYESGKTSERVQRALTANLKAGKPHGRVPFGYVREYDRHRNLVGQVPDPDTAWVVREVITRIADWEPVMKVARDMERRGAPTPKGGPWSGWLVRRICMNHAYVGQRHYDPGQSGQGVTYDGWEGWESLVDLATWQTAYGRLTASHRDSGRPGNAKRYLLSYLATCDVCQGPLAGRKVRNLIYFCREGACSSMRMDWLDEFVTGATCQLLSHPAFWKQLLAPGDEETRAAQAELAGLERRLAEHQELAIAGKISADGYAKIEAGFMAKIRNAERRVTPAAPLPPSLLELRGQRDPKVIRAVFEGWPLSTRKEVLRVLYDEIVLKPAGRGGWTAGFNPDRVRLLRKGEREKIVKFPPC